MEAGRRLDAFADAQAEGTSHGWPAARLVAVLVGAQAETGRDCDMADVAPPHGQPVIAISAHPSIWASVLRLATTGATVDRAAINRGLERGSLQLSEAAAWSTDKRSRHRGDHPGRADRLPDQPAMAALVPRGDVPHRGARHTRRSHHQLTGADQTYGKSAYGVRDRTDPAVRHPLPTAERAPPDWREEP
jgi:hypothetical protein